jgi:hypothetical protein
MMPFPTNQTPPACSPLTNEGSDRGCEGETWSSETKNKGASPLATASLQQELGPTLQVTHRRTHTGTNFHISGVHIGGLVYICFLFVFLICRLEKRREPEGASERGCLPSRQLSFQRPCTATQNWGKGEGAGQRPRHSPVQPYHTVPGGTACPPR